MLTTLFRTDIGSAKADLDSRGYALVTNAMTDEFLSFCDEQLSESIQTGRRALEDRDVYGKKRQYSFELPDDSNLRQQLYSAVGRLFGAPAANVTLSERHYKVYLPEAPARPIPHKDRHASTLSIGIPLFVTDLSCVFLYPNHLRSVNPYDSGRTLRQNLRDDELPENALRNVEPVRLFARRGDAAIFLGSSMFHDREHAASSRVLYLKFNVVGDDPLGEDLRS